MLVTVLMDGQDICHLRHNKAYIGKVSWVAETAERYRPFVFRKLVLTGDLRLVYMVIIPLVRSTDDHDNEVACSIHLSPSGVIQVEDRTHLPYTDRSCSRAAAGDRHSRRAKP